MKPIERDQVKDAVLECLKDLSGQATTAVLETGMLVVKQLGLQSEDGLELACDLSARLGIEIPHNINPLFDEPKRGVSCERTIGQVIDFIYDLAIKQKEAQHV